MGNAPLSCPPRPTEYRVIIPVATTRKFGVKLVVFPPCIPQNDSAPLATTTTTNTLELPPQLESRISIQEYKIKMQQLHERLEQWKGGWATVFLLTFSLLLVTCFIAAYLTPAFWNSALFHHPGYIVAIAVVVLGILSGLIRFVRRESHLLMRDVQELYRCWRGRGVVVTMKHVSSSYSSTQSGIPRRRQGRQRQRGASGANCYCIVMNVVNDEEDNVSVGTVMTDDSRQSANNSDDDDQDKERSNVIVVSAVDGDVK